MPGPGQSDLQVMGSKATDLTRIQYQHEQAHKMHGEAAVVRQQEQKEIERTTVQKQEGAQGGRVDRDGRRGQGQTQQQPDGKDQEGKEQRRAMGYGTRLDISV